MRINKTNWWHIVDQLKLSFPKKNSENMNKLNKTNWACLIDDLINHTELVELSEDKVPEDVELLREAISELSQEDSKRLFAAAYTFWIVARERHLKEMWGKH